MLAKYWKQIGLFILIIAILFNVTIKLMNKVSLKKTISQSAQYMLEHDDENTANQNTVENDSNNIVNTDKGEVNTK